MTSGAIKSWIPEKGYGFISGEDGKSYFLHKNSFASKNTNLSAINDGAIVEFEPTATPKGYRAENVSIIPVKACTRFNMPEDFIMTRHKRVGGWEILKASEWMVVAESRDLDDARAALELAAKTAGANAIINLHRASRTESEASDSGKGEHKYTVHEFAGQMALVGKRSMRGSNDLDFVRDIDTFAREQYQRTQEKRDRTTKVVGSLAVLGALMSLIGPELKYGFIAWIPGGLYALLIGWKPHYYLPIKD